MRTANRQQFKRELRREIKESEREQYELTEEEASYIREYMEDNYNFYEYEMDWLWECTEDSEVFDGRDYAGSLYAEFDYDDGWLELD